MNKKRISMVILVLVMLVSLVACSDGSSTEQSPAAPPPEPTDSAEGDTDAPAPFEMPKIMSICSSASGSTSNTTAIGIASVVTNHTATELKAIATSGPIEYVPMMAAGDVDLGAVGDYEILLAYLGDPPYDNAPGGKGYDVSILMCRNAQFVALLVAGDSGIQTAADIVGKRYIYEYTGNPQPTAFAQTFLANHGLTKDDIIPISIESIPLGITAIIEGRADVAISAINVATLHELESAKGVRFLGLDSSDEGMARAREIYPPVYSTTFDGNSGNQWITEETHCLTYDSYIIARGDLPDEVAYEIVKALFENNDELRASNPALEGMFLENYVSTHVTLPYHPGAIKFFKEKGLWTPEMEALQAANLALRN